MAATTSSQCLPIQVGISFAGEPCGHAELPSVEGCCALCEQTPSCLFFTHWSGLADAAPSRCELYSTRTDSELAPEHATVTSGALPRAHWRAPSAAACRFSTPEPGTLATAPLAASQAFATLEAAQAACVALDQSCTGVTGVSTGVTGSGGPRGRYRVRGGTELLQSPTGELASFKVGCDGAWCDLLTGHDVQPRLEELLSHPDETIVTARALSHPRHHAAGTSFTKTLACGLTNAAAACLAMPSLGIW